MLLLGNPHGWRSLVGCSPWGCQESDTTEWLHFHFSLSRTGEGNGNPLQCSCLENPRDGGAWWATIYGVAQSWTRLKRLSSSSYYLSYFNGSFSAFLLLATLWWWFPEERENLNSIHHRYSLGTMVMFLEISPRNHIITPKIQCQITKPWNFLHPVDLISGLVCRHILTLLANLALLNTLFPQLQWFYCLLISFSL